MSKEKINIGIVSKGRLKEQSEKVTYEDDNDDALSSFSPEVVEVINEEEEKVA